MTPIERSQHDDDCWGGEGCDCGDRVLSKEEIAALGDAEKILDLMQALGESLARGVVQGSGE